ncbi:MAG: 30S ribosomal protein S6 [Patescibacteria group bacterium]
MPKGIIYEFAYLISGQLDEIQAQGLAKKIEKRLEENSVILGSIEPKKIKLAYLIKKQQDGYLVSVDFTCEPASLIGISKEIEKEADILRFLFIKKSAKKPEPIKERPLITEVEEKKEVITEKAKKPASAPPEARSVAGKEEDLKKIEKDLDEILGQ